MNAPENSVRHSEILVVPAAGVFRRLRFWQLLPRSRGAFWVLLAMAPTRLLGPIFTIALRRFLGPGASGIFDLAFTPYKFLDSFRNFGTGPALVYETAVSRTVANTAWTVNVVFAVLVTGAAQLVAHPVAVYYGHPQVEGMLRVLSIAYIFASAASAHTFLLMRDFDFRARSIPAIGQVAAGGLVAILFALWGFGIGALVARELASVITGAVLLWVVYPFRPRIELVPSIAWTLLRYGVWIGAGLTIMYVSQNVDVFIGGRIIRNNADIGFYTTSWKLAFIAAGVFTTVASTMIFPTLTRMRGDRDALRETLLVSVRQLGVVIVPAATLLAALAPVVIVPLLGEKWVAYRSSFLVLSLLALYAGNRTLLAIFFEGYKAIGKPWIVPAYHSVKLALVVPTMIYGAQHGILGLALTYIPIQILEFPASLALAERVLKVSPAQIWTEIRSIVVATGVMLVTVIAGEVLCLRGLHLGDLLTLAICSVAGVAIYGGILLLIDRAVFAEMRRVLSSGF